jgi:hypothetical protein
MKTISLKTLTISEDVADRRDGLYKAGKTFKRTTPMQNADGLHFYSTLPDGQTTTHTFISIEELEALVERLEPNFKRPVK